MCDTEKWYNHPRFVLYFSHFLTAIVFPLHFLGAYCILKRTPASMSSVKWTILNQHLWNILGDCLVNILVVPCPLLPSASGYTLGLFNLFGVSGLTQYWISATVFTILCVSTTMIFENRFYLLVAENTRWKRIRPFWMLANLVFCFTFTIPLVLQVPDQQSSRDIILRSLKCVPEFLKHTEVIVLAVDGLIIIYTGIMFTSVVFGQLVVFTIAIKVRWSSKLGTTSGHTRRLQKNVLKALILQTAILFFYLQLPVVIASYVIVTQIHSFAINNILVSVAACHGLVSSMSMILIHHPYRKTFSRYFEKPTSRISTAGRAA